MKLRRSLGLGIGIIGATGLLLWGGAALTQTQPVCDESNPETSNGALLVSVQRVGSDFSYDYSIANPETSSGCFRGAMIFIKSRVPSTSADVSVGPDVSLDSTDPLFFKVPGSYDVASHIERCDATLGNSFWWSCADILIDENPIEAIFADGPSVRPGQTLHILSIRSPLPPGLYKSRLYPEWDPDAPDTLFVAPAQLHVDGVVLGPTHPSELMLYEGDGAEADAVNKVLRYSNPVTALTNLRFTEARFPVAILYGASVSPSSFQAVLDGVDVTARFSPAPDRHEVVSLDLALGRDNVLQLNADGAGGTDLDLLVLRVASLPGVTPTPTPLPTPPPCFFSEPCECCVRASNPPGCFAEYEFATEKTCVLTPTPTPDCTTNPGDCGPTPTPFPIPTPIPDLGFCDQFGCNPTPIMPTPTPTPSNHAPVCAAAVAAPSSPWPPNHKLVAISIAGVTDPDGDPVTVSPASVRQDEPVSEAGSGAGNTQPDATLVPLAVRSERNGNPRSPGDGRVYHVAFTASDGRGGSCSGSVAVCVPHDQGSGSSCVDGGPLFDSLVP